METKLSLKEFKELQSTLTKKGFREDCSVISSNPKESAVYYSHSDGRKAKIMLGEIIYYVR